MYAIRKVPCTFTLKVLVEPPDGLQKCLLFAKSVQRFSQVSSHSESVGNAAKEVNLIWLLSANESILRLMPEVSGENVINFWISF